MAIFNSEITPPWSRLPSQMMTHLAQRERQSRKALGLSQEALAERADVSLGSLKRFERTGQISLESLLKLAFALGCLDEFEILFSPRDEPGSLDEIIGGS